MQCLGRLCLLKVLGLGSLGLLCLHSLDSLCQLKLLGLGSLGLLRLQSLGSLCQLKLLYLGSLCLLRLLALGSLGLLGLLCLDSLGLLCLNSLCRGRDRPREAGGRLVGIARGILCTHRKGVLAITQIGKVHGAGASDETSA